MGNEVTLDEVTIQINASAAQANSNIDGLLTTLSELQTAARGTGKSLDKLASGLLEFGSTSKYFEYISNQSQKLKPMIDTIAQLSNIPSPRGFTKILKDLEAVPNAFNNIANNANVMENITRVSNQLSQALTPLAEKLQNIASGFNAINALANKYGVQVTKLAQTSKRSTASFKKFGEGLSNIGRGLGKGANSIFSINSSFFKSIDKYAKSAGSKLKQIGLSLLGTRTIFTATRKAVSEYMAMDADLTWQITNNWRALGAQLAPAIEYVMNIFKQFVRVIYSVVLALTGVDLIARANQKALEKMAKSAKDTLAGLQKFDDLNVAEFPKSEGENNLIEMDTIDLSPIQKIIDWIRKLKDEIKSALDTGEWANVGKVFAEGINGGLRAIKFNTLNKKLKNIAKNFGDFLQGFVNELEWDTLGTKLTQLLKLIPDTITSFLQAIPWSDVGKGLTSFLTTFSLSDWTSSILNEFNTLVFGIQDLFLNIDWGLIGKQISDSLMTIINKANELILNINWSEWFKKLEDAIRNIDFKGIGENLATTINNFFSNFDFAGLADSISSFAHGLLTSIDSFVKTLNWKEIGSKIVEFILDIDWAQLAVDLLQFVEDLWTGLLDAADGAGHTVWEFLEKLFHGSEEDPRNFGQKIADGFEQGFVDGTQSKLKTGSRLGGVLGSIKGFIKGFFGIHSPSTWARDEVGKNLVEGMIQPFSTIWDKSKGYFSTFKNKLDKDFEASKFADIGRNIISGIKDGLKSIGDTLNNIFKPAINGVIGLFNNMINKINNKLYINIGSSISSILSLLGVNIPRGGFQLFSIPNIPQLEVGTNNVPYEGLYHLHPGEAVVPKKYNPAVGGTNDETNSRLDTLISILQNMDTTTVVNVGNETLYKQQQKYNRMQNDKYGTNINL